ncbi:MAG: hypothetical protein WCT49_05440 [Candidatus Paceibacterota bacterium]
MTHSIRKKIHIFFVATGLFFGGVFFVSAATISFTPSSGSFNTGKTFTVAVTIDGSGQPINSSEAKISFDKTALSVQSLSKDGSPFGMWPADPAFDNAAGTVSYTGGATAPFSGKKNIISIVFKALKEGSTGLSFSSASVMSGPGTEVLSASSSAAFTITAAAVEETPTPVTPPATVGGSASLPAIPVISSDSHPDPEKWYKEKTASFKWNLPRDVDNVRILLDDNARSVPSISNTPPISSKVFKDVGDGTKYFHVMFHNKSGWGTPAHRQVLIDTTPPDKFTIESRSDTPGIGDTSLVFLVTDKSSGIDHYKLSIDGGASTTVQTKDVTSKGEYKLDSLPEGNHTAKVLAVDKVGNITEASAEFTVVKAAPIAAASTGDQIVVESASPIPYYVSFIFLALCVFLAGLLYSERRKFVREKEELKTESDEAGDKLGKIFTALRDEAEEQIHALSGKPNLSDSEREILERLKEALDLSEELLEKEVEDVRKLLR